MTFFFVPSSEKGDGLLSSLHKQCIFATLSSPWEEEGDGLRLSLLTGRRASILCEGEKKGIPLLSSFFSKRGLGIAFPLPLKANGMACFLVPSCSLLLLHAIHTCVRHGEHTGPKMHSCMLSIPV